MPTPILFLLVLLASGVCVLLFVLLAVRTRDRVFPPKETVWGGGIRTALLIYQPSHQIVGTRMARALAQALVKAGYTVTMNRPSPALTYDPTEFSYLLFGGTVYMDDIGQPLNDYLSGLRFQGKRVLLYSIGDAEKAPELAGLRLCVPVGNRVRTIKVRDSEIDKLCAFATYE